MAKKPYRMQKFTIPRYIFQALEFLKPPEDITVSEWAEKYRILDERSSAMAGHWKNEVTPYLRGIMDEFNNWSTEKIVFCKPTQVGGTECMNNMIAYCTAQDPAPCMIVEPTEVMAESFSENRLQPMFKKSPATKSKFNSTASSKLELQFEGMYITLAGSNSPSGLASKPIRFLFLDEIDKFPGATNKEADPVSLAMERTKTFSDRKIYMCSTPTTTEGKIWRELKYCDEERHYFVPCAHCGEMIELTFDHLHIPDRQELTEIDRAALASYICQECGAMITDADKIKMLQDGEWRSIRKSGKNIRSVGFWLSTLYSPFTSFAEIAKAYIMSKGDSELYHNFSNSWLGVPYEEQAEEMESDIIRKKETDIPEFIIPEWCRFLAAGVDVQKNSLYYTIIAGGVNFTTHVITCGQVADFADIENIMNREYLTEDGQKKLIDLCLIDSGARTDEVYDFCLQNQDWIMPVKGSSNAMLSHYKISRINKEGSNASGLPLVIVDGGKYKDMIFSRIKRTDPSGSLTVHKEISAEYCEQMVAEHKVAETKGGVTIYRWKPKKSHADNHLLDCTVYAFASLDLLGIRQLFAEEQEHAHAEIIQRRRTTTETRSEYNQECNQSRKNDYTAEEDDWIAGGSW